MMAEGSTVGALLATCVLAASLTKRTPNHQGSRRSALESGLGSGGGVPPNAASHHPQAPALLPTTATTKPHHVGTAFTVPRVPDARANTVPAAAARWRRGT